MLPSFDPGVSRSINVVDDLNRHPFFQPLDLGRLNEYHPTRCPTLGDDSFISPPEMDQRQGSFW